MALLDEPKTAASATPQPLSSVRRMLDRPFAFAAQHPLWTTFLVAISVRASAAAFITIFLGGTLFDDDNAYITMASQRATGEDAAWDAFTNRLYTNTSTLLVPLTLLYRVFGTSIFLGQLFVALFGAITAVLVARLATEAVGHRATLPAGLLVALLPSQVVVSAVVMKDAQVWALLAGLALLVAISRRVSLRQLAAIAVATVLMLALLGGLRVHTLVVASVALMLGGGLARGRWRVQRALGAAAIGLFMPMIFGAGIGGAHFILNNAEAVGDIRAYNARGGSAIPAAAREAGSTEAGRGSSRNTAPIAPTTLDDTSGEASLRYLPHGLLAMTVEPFPWRTGGSASQRVAQAEAVVWYPVLALAAIGLWDAIRRRRDVLSYPIILGGGILVMWALIEGNIGTAYRHRGEFAWVVCLLASLGACSLITRRRDRRSQMLVAPRKDDPACSL